MVQLVFAIQHVHLRNCLHLYRDRSTHTLKLFHWQIATGLNTKDHAYLTYTLCVIDPI